MATRCPAVGTHFPSHREEEAELACVIGCISRIYARLKTVILSPIPVSTDRQYSSQISSSRPVSGKSDALTTRLPSHLDHRSQSDPQCRPRSFIMALFDKLHVTSYRASIVSVFILCRLRNITVCFMTQELAYCWYHKLPSTVSVSNMTVKILVHA